MIDILCIHCSLNCLGVFFDVSSSCSVYLSCEQSDSVYIEVADNSLRELALPGVCSASQAS